MLADDACAGFRASRSAPAIIMLHTHELLGSEQRKTKKVQRALAKRGAEVVVESATGAAQEVLSAWFSTLVPGERADLPIEQVLLGRPAALLIRWRSPEGRVGQGVAGVGVVRAGREVLWGFNGDWVEASWPQLAELLKPEVKP